MNLLLIENQMNKIGQPMNQKKTEKQGGLLDFSKISAACNKTAVMMEKIPMERIERVHEIKRKIMDGTYYVDSEKIAERILKNILVSQM
jgi:flagellar biosynthesis anti-sigma factor FlgM